LECQYGTIKTLWKLKDPDHFDWLLSNVAKLDCEIQHGTKRLL